MSEAAAFFHMRMEPSERRRLNRIARLVDPDGTLKEYVMGAVMDRMTRDEARYDELLRKLEQMERTSQTEQRSVS